MLSKQVVKSAISRDILDRVFSKYLKTLFDLRKFF